MYNTIQEDISILNETKKASGVEVDKCNFHLGRIRVALMYLEMKCEKQISTVISLVIPLVL